MIHKLTLIVSLALVCSATAYADWTPTGSMSTERALQTATLLPNGKVLVAGGGNVMAVAISSAELYDPATGLWADTGSMSNERIGHTATLLPNGKVLVAGGFNSMDSPMSSAELYDPATGLWTPTGSMSTERASHTATLLPNGKVLVVGGMGWLAGTAELYDPATGLWTDTGNITWRFYHTATLLPNGKVLVAGGIETGDVETRGVELYDPATGLWTDTGGLSIGRGLHTATLLPNGKVLVVGGAVSRDTPGSAELYDPVTGLWTDTGSMLSQHSSHTATLLPNGKVLVAGGDAWDAEAMNSAELYDPATGLWTATGSMSDERGGHTATLLPNGKVLVAGGYEAIDAQLSSAELYGEPAPPPVPVVLVHGICSDPAGSFGQMGKLLGGAGITVADPFNYNPSNSLTIEEIADDFAEHIQNTVLKDNPSGQVDIVAYSMGGLVARTWMAGMSTGLPYTGQIRKLITIATPNYGSVIPSVPLIDLFACSDTQLNELELGSNFVLQLHQKWGMPGPIAADNIVMIAGTYASKGQAECGPLEFEEGCNDGVVEIASAVLPYSDDEMIRYVPYPHNTDLALIYYNYPPPDSRSVSYVEDGDTDHLTYKLVTEFLKDGKVLPQCCGQGTLDYNPPHQRNETDRLEGLLVTQLLDKNNNPLTYLRKKPDIAFYPKVKRGSYVVFWNPDSAGLTVWGLQEGTYTLSLTVKHNKKSETVYYSDVPIVRAKPIVLPPAVFKSIGSTSQ